MLPRYCCTLHTYVHTHRSIVQYRRIERQTPGCHGTSSAVSVPSLLSLWHEGGIRFIAINYVDYSYAMSFLKFEIWLSSTRLQMSARLLLLGIMWSGLFFFPVQLAVPAILSRYTCTQKLLESYGRRVFPGALLSTYVLSFAGILSPFSASYKRVGNRTYRYVVGFSILSVKPVFWRFLPVLPL